MHLCLPDGARAGGWRDPAWRFAKLVGRLGRGRSGVLLHLLLGLAQEFDLLPQGFLHDFSPILKEMPTIEHLLGLWRTCRCSNPVTRPSVTADDLNALMGLEPLFEDLLITAHQEVHDPMLLQIDENASRGMLALKSPIVHSQYTWSRHLPDAGATKQSQQR